MATETVIMQLYIETSCSSLTTKKLKETLNMMLPPPCFSVEVAFSSEWADFVVRLTLFALIRLENLFPHVQYAFWYKLDFIWLCGKSVVIEWVLGGERKPTQTQGEYAQKFLTSSNTTTQPIPVPVYLFLAVGSVLNRLELWYCHKWSCLTYLSKSHHSGISIAHFNSSIVKGSCLETKKLLS